jgi:hypothetical protein
MYPLGDSLRKTELRMFTDQCSKVVSMIANTFATKFVLGVQILFAANAQHPQII